MTRFQPFTVVGYDPAMPLASFVALSRIAETDLDAKQTTQPVIRRFHYQQKERWMLFSLRYSPEHWYIRQIQRVGADDEYEFISRFGLPSAYRSLRRLRTHLIARRLHNKPEWQAMLIDIDASIAAHGNRLLGVDLSQVAAWPTDLVDTS